MGSFTRAVRRTAAVMALLWICEGCTAWQPLSPGEPVQSPPVSFRSYYDYPSLSSETHLNFETRHGDYVMRQVEIPLSLPAGRTMESVEETRKEVKSLEAENPKRAADLELAYTNRIDLYLPADRSPGEKLPVILISPILGGNMVVDFFARFYARNGFAAAVVHRKRPELEDDAKDLTGIEEYMRLSVIRLRQALDWLERQPEIDGRRAGSLGISYGAMLHSVLAAVEPRIRYHLLAMPAGPLPEVILHCPEGSIRKLRAKARNELGWTNEKIEEELWKRIRTDPLLAAPYIDRGRVEMYVALFDRVVGAGRSLRLWREMGKPRLKVMPSGHYGGILAFPLLLVQSWLAFKYRLKA